MQSDESDLGGLEHRLASMYRRLGATQPRPTSEFPAWQFAATEFVGIEQDFRGGLTDSEIQEVIEALIYNVAHVKDPLKKRVLSDGVNANVVEEYISTAQSLPIVVDLANVAKHGYPLKRPRSKHEPQLKNVGRSLRLTTGKGPSRVTFSLDPRTGKSQVVATGGGSVGVEFEGDVIDKNGARIGDVMEIIRSAIEEWERLLNSLGISLPNAAAK